MEEYSLRNKTIKGVGWSAADALLGQGVTFVTGLVLARLLSPEEYGLVGICLIFTTILNGIVDSGFSNALIRKKDTTNEDYNTMFITNLGISIVLYVLLFFASSNISTFFEREELTPLIKVMGSVLIINALSITQITVLTKKIDFKTKTKTSLVSWELDWHIRDLVCGPLSRRFCPNKPYIRSVYGFSIVGGLTSASTRRTLNICGDSDRN